MHTITQGQRLPVATVAGCNEFQVKFNIASDLTLDLACFGLDAAGKLSNDAYMVFFNQLTSPCGSVKMVDGSTYNLALDQLPACIDKLVFAVSIDGPGTMSQLRLSNFQILTGGEVKGSCVFSGATFALERALMMVELYRKDGAWRLNSVLQGFNEGLDALVRHFGGEVAEEAPTAPAAAPTAPAKVSLEKKVEAAAPELVSLAKKAGVSLAKAGVSDLQAIVELVLDGSGSMNNQYKKGRVQEVVNRVLPLAVNFDDDGLLECSAFGDYPQQLSPIGLHNFRNYIDTDHGGWRNWELGARINTEWRVIEQVIERCKRKGGRTPVYVVFISDGGITDSRKIIGLIRDAASLPIFWQFIGLAGRGYGILEKLDDLDGRVVDNCNFFALDDLNDISEEELYDRLMEEFPGWLKAAKAAGIIA
ncbi:VWA domain-containing protein [Geopseudomonas aromaticivorans]